MNDLPEVIAPVSDLGTGDALESWRWLVGTSATPRLLTASGDLIVAKPVGLFRREAIFLLDTYAGTFAQIASSWATFKKALAEDDPDVAEWFKLGLVVALREHGLLLERGQCYSPIHPPVLGGSYAPENFETTHWRVHVGIMGQIHEQTKDLPAGTRITGITSEG